MMKGWTVSPRASRLCCRLASSWCAGMNSDGGNKTNWRCCCRRSITTAHALTQKENKSCNELKTCNMLGQCLGLGFGTSENVKFKNSMCMFFYNSRVLCFFYLAEKKLTIGHPLSIQLWWCIQQRGTVFWRAQAAPFPVCWQSEGEKAPGWPLTIHLQNFLIKPSSVQSSLINIQATHQDADSLCRHCLSWFLPTWELYQDSCCL